MRVVVARVHENLFDGEAESLTAPTTEGEITVLSKHEPMVATLKPGAVVVRAGGKESRFDVTGGVIEISGDQVTVLL